MAGRLRRKAVVPVLIVLSVEVVALLALVGVRVLLIAGAAEDALEEFHDEWVATDRLLVNSRGQVGMTEK